MRGIVKSLATTMSTFIRGPVTRGYPSKHRELPERDRAFPLLLWDKDIGKNFKHICQIRDSVLKFSDELFDRCAAVLTKTPNKTIDMVTIFKTVLRHQPRLLLELRHLVLAGWI